MSDKSPKKNGYKDPVKDEVEEQKEYVQQLEKELLARQGQFIPKINAIEFAHDISTPIGVSVTANSYLEDRLKALSMRLEEISDVKSNEFKMEKTLEILDSGELKNLLNAISLVSLNLVRVNQLTNSFMRVSIEQLHEVNKEINLCMFFKDIILSISPKFKHKKITYDVNGDKKLMVNTLPGCLSQIFINLIDNSIGHGFSEKNEGNFKIEYEIKDKKLVIVYSDNGKGIGQNLLPSIFEPFVTSKADEGGVGIGLHLVRDIIRSKFNGDINCTSETAKGTTFCIKIPID